VPGTRDGSIGPEPIRIAVHNDSAEITLDRRALLDQSGSERIAWIGERISFGAVDD